MFVLLQPKDGLSWLSLLALIKALKKPLKLTKAKGQNSSTNLGNFPLRLPAVLFHAVSVLEISERSLEFRDSGVVLLVLLKAAKNTFERETEMSVA